MKNWLWLAVAGAFSAAPAQAAVDLSAALKAMSTYNLIVFDTLETNGQEVEGKTFTRNLQSNNSTNFGKGNGGQPNAGQSAAEAGGDVLTVVNNAAGTFHLMAGNANGGNGVVGDTLRVGGDVGYLDFNDAGAYAGKVVAGGSLTQFFNVNNHAVTYGGTAPGGMNGLTHDPSLAPGGANDLKAALDTKLTGIETDLVGLSAYLGGLKPLAQITAKTAALDYSGAANGLAVFNMTADAFTGGGEFDNLFAGIAENYVTVINVAGSGTLTAGGNNNKLALNQKLIWNFTDATEVKFAGFHGSVLATKATVSNGSALEGTIVARNFKLGGEVHLGTYAGGDGFLTPPTNPPVNPPVLPSVPEPATWAMMIAGFGAVGAAARARRRRPVAA